MTLREIRKSSGLTMKQIAEKAGVSECLICLIETGKKTPGVKTAKRIAPVYGIEWTDFFKDDKEVS